MEENRTYHSPASKHFIVTAVVLVILFWIIETALEVYVFHLGNTFRQHLFFPSLHELWMRFIVASLSVLAVVLAYYLSKHREIESSLRDNEAKFHSLFNQATDSIFLMRPAEDDLIIEDVNEAACNMHGYAREELIGNSIGLLDDPETRKLIRERVSGLMSGKPLNVEAIHIRKDGSTFPLEVAAQRIQIGENPYVLAIDRDITSRKQAEQEIVKSKELLTSIMDSLDSLVYVADMENYEILFLNKYGRDRFGDISGSTCWKKIQNDQTGPCEFCTNKYLVDDKGRPTGVYTWEFQNTRNKHWYFIHDRAISWTEGQLVRMEIATDITDRKNAELELKERMKLAELNADLGIAFTTGVTLQDSLQKCSESLVYHLDILFARIWLFDKEEKILALKASAGLYTNVNGSHSRIPYGKNKIGIIAKEMKPHLTNDVSSDPEIKDQEWVRKEKIVSFAGHPLILKNRLIGVMAMFSRNVLPEITLNTLSSVANQLVIGIDQKIKEDQVLQAKEQWETTFDTIPDIVIVIDRNHIIMRANRALAKRLGIDRKNIIGKPCYTIVHGTSEPPSFCPHTEVIADGKERTEEIFDKNLNGHFQFSATPILDTMGNVTATVHVARDITKRKQMEEKLKEAAITDDLTGLLNRRGFFALADQQCRLSDRTKQGITLLFIDLDGMKAINDELGHSAGDRALKDIAILLNKSFRGADIKARMGGDEFAVLLTEPSDYTEPAAISHLMKNISDHNKFSGRNFELMISIGMSHYDPDAPCSIEDLLIRADSLMYEDKISHKDTKPVLTGKTLSSAKRKHIRRVMHESYHVHLSDQQGKSFEGIKITNISAGGLCMGTPDRLTKGNVYNIKIHCDKTREINARVRVVWTSPEISDIGKEAVNQFHAGLKFEAMDSALQTQLAVFLEALSEA